MSGIGISTLLRVRDILRGLRDITGTQNGDLQNIIQEIDGAIDNRPMASAASRGQGSNGERRGPGRPPGSSNRNRAQGTNGSSQQRKLTGRNAAPAKGSAPNAGGKKRVSEKRRTGGGAPQQTQQDATGQG